MHSLASFIMFGGSLCNRLAMFFRSEIIRCVFPSRLCSPRTLCSVAAFYVLYAGAQPPHPPSAARILLCQTSPTRPESSVVVPHVKKTDSEACVQFLRFISGQRGMRHLLLIGMLADASLECLLLTRQMDAEDTDPAMLQGRVREFLNTIQKLFIEQHCVNTGMTKRMISEIKKQHMWFDHKVPTYIGRSEGIDPEGLAECLKRMAAWVSLSARVINAEFPSFEAAQAFRVLSWSASGDSVGDLDSLHEDFERLAHTFQLDEAVLKAEYQGLIGLARAIQRETRGSTRDAWCSAIKKVQGRLAKSYPCKVLSALLHRYMVWSISSSGVEQNFSVRKLIATPRRKRLSEQRELDELQVRTFVEGNPVSVGDVLLKAQSIWKPVFGGARLSKLRLRGYTKAKPAGETAMSMGEALRKRQAEVSALPSPAPMDASALARRAQADSGDVWGASHQKEARRQQTQRNLRLVESAAQGVVRFAPESNLHAAVIALRSAADSRRDHRDREAAKTASLLRDHHVTWLHKAVHNGSSMSLQEIAGYVPKLHFRLVDDVANADICIVETMDSPGSAVLWGMLLKGGSIVQATYLRNLAGGGAPRPGPCLSFLAARQTRRTFWLSRGFLREKQEAANIIIAVTAGYWTSVGTAVEWLSLVQAHPRSQMTYLGFLTSAEKAAVNKKSGLVEAEALKFLLRADRSQCSSGLT